MSVRITRKNNIYPVEGSELEPGEIYEGSDLLLYCAVNMKCKTNDGEELLAIGIDHDSYITDGPGGAMSFRKIDVNIEYS